MFRTNAAARPAGSSGYSRTSPKLRKPANLKSLTSAIDKLDWYSAREEGLGNLYEGLLEKNAAEKKSGAGQYFTPRPLIDCMVRLMQPAAGEVIQDPAAGTGGFLVAADRFIRDATNDFFTLSETDGQFQRTQALNGFELAWKIHDGGARPGFVTSSRIEGVAP
jgi:type I restriction enzyme M protein